MKVNENADRLFNNQNSPKYYRETPTRAKETNQYKSGNTHGPKAGSKNVSSSFGKPSKG